MNDELDDQVKAFHSRTEQRTNNNTAIYARRSDQSRVEGATQCRVIDSCIESTAVERPPPAGPRQTDVARPLYQMQPMTRGWVW